MGVCSSVSGCPVVFVDNLTTLGHLKPDFVGKFFQIFALLDDICPRPAIFSFRANSFSLQNRQCVVGLSSRCLMLGGSDT